MKLLRMLILTLMLWPAATIHASERTPTEVCPVTHATDFELPAGVEPESIWGTGLIHNGEVGLLLGYNGVIPLRKDTMGEKISWWKKDENTNLTASARNVFTGEEIHDIRTTPYASYPQSERGIFLMSGINFPSDGCWELIATSDHSELRVTVMVILVPPTVDPTVIRG